MYDSESVITLGTKTTFTPKRERALLVGIDWPQAKWSLDSSLAELSRLADTAGADTVCCTTQKIKSPNPKTFVGSGKVREIADLAIANDVDVIIFDDELTPSQQSNLEKSVDRNIKVIDRTALILDIFALHAKTHEGRLQVRLAQNQYLYPRLRGMWAHLASNRMGGGVGSRFGEGESQLEVDRRMVRKRITSIKRELAHLEEVRKVQRANRYESGLFKIALAGYTNAGKSSLLNKITDSDVLSYDKLFATLDSTTRKLTLPEGREVTLSDTVGFIQKLPTTLVEAFKSTLDEISNADLILHVIDSSSEEYESQMEAVFDVLEQIGAQNIPCIQVFNKTDLLSKECREALRSRFPLSNLVSAETGFGLDKLLKTIGMAAAASDKHMILLVPYKRGDLVSLAHKKCQVMREEHTADGTILEIRASDRISRDFKDFEVDQTLV